MTRADRVVMAFELFMEAKIDYLMCDTGQDDDIETATDKLNKRRNELVSILLALLAKEDQRI